MKTKQYLTIAAILLTSSLSAFAKNDDKIPGATVQDAAFFTGKPYDADLESYVFNYRNYSAEANRWTTADPSGFSDGANNQFYAPVATSEIDPNGLWTVKLTAIGSGWAKTGQIGDGTRNLFVTSSFTANGDVNEKKDSWTLSGYTAAALRDASGNVIPDTTVNISQSYTVTVTSNGVIQITGSGQAETGGNIRVAMLGEKESQDNGKALTFTYTGSGAFSASGVTGANLSIPKIGGGGGLTWTNPTQNLKGFIEASFEAVE